MSIATRIGITQFVVLLASIAIGAWLYSATLAHADPTDAGLHLDPIVAADHAPRAVAALPPADDVLIAPPYSESPPTFGARVLRTGLTLFQGALGGIVLYGVGKLFAFWRRRKGWLRRGWVGDISATLTAVLLVAGGALAIGANWEGAMMALGTTIVGGRLLASDPDTVRRTVPPAVAVVVSGEIEVPT